MQEADERNLAKIRWQARMELGGVFTGVDDARADRFFSESLDLLEAQQSSVLLEGFRAGMLGRTLAQYDPYDRYIQFLLARNEVEKAFVTAERARARVFLETLSGARAELAAALPEAFIREETDLLERMSAGQARLRAPDVTASERARLVSSIEQADDDLTALRLRLAVDHPSAAHARFPRLWSAGELQNEILRDDETLAMFFLGRDASVCWLVERDSLRVVELPGRDEIAQAVQRLLPTLQSPRAQVDEDARAWLSRTLVAPIVNHVKEGAHLLVVPHASLNYLPFEVLAAEEGRHVIERHTVSYAPSVSSLAHLRASSESARRPAAVLAVGNPITSAAGASDERDTPLQWIGRLKPLPHSRTELQRIQSTFRPNVRLLHGPEATEPALRDALASGGVGILHLATHAFIDETQPERSGLVLSAGGERADGLLQTREVYRLALPAALVTLSACETALGREVTGEGIVGIARAFFYAGATTVAASLWNVSDSSTAALMADFYERIRAGAPVDRALADAKRAMLRGRGETHPYYWAPFIAMGHARVALEFPESARVPAIVPLLAAGVALAGLFVAMVVARRVPRSRWPSDRAPRR
jgi:CHAT domain-containing protein